MGNTYVLSDSGFVAGDQDVGVKLGLCGETVVGCEVRGVELFGWQARA
jgi:hypothetical protein